MYKMKYDGPLSNFGYNFELRCYHSAQRNAAREFARVLKPGGKLFFVDSVQAGGSLMTTSSNLITSFSYKIDHPSDSTTLCFSKGGGFISKDLV
jgi:SAM-dependent methyltransferase